MVDGIITEIKKFASHDGPGIRTTVFCKGCPLNCRWCSNPETIHSYPEVYFVSSRCKAFGDCIDVCPQNAIGPGQSRKIDRNRCDRCMICVRECPYGAFKQVGSRVTTQTVLDEILKDQPFFGDDGGLTLSGGEPLFQPDFSISLLKACHENGISTVLDTSGHAPTETVMSAMAHTDLVLLDIKHMAPKRHREGTGVDNRLILENAGLMATCSTVRISIPLIPGFNDTIENITETAEFAGSLGVDTIDVNPLHGLGADKYRCLGLESPYEQFDSVDQQHLRTILELIHSFGLKTTVGRMM